MGFSTTKMTVTFLLFVTAVHGYPYTRNFDEVNPFSDDFYSLDNWIDQSVNSIFTFDHQNGESNYEFNNHNELAIDEYDGSEDSTEETDEYVEDDIIISESRTRNGLKAASARWPGGVIPYKINSKFSAAEKKLVREAMDEYHKNTCIKFTPHQSTEGDFVRIRPSQRGCSSNVGRQGGRQNLNLSAECSKIKGKVIHELMHAIGFRHEHCRTDRDNYVEIKWENIKDGQANNFKKYSSKLIDPFGERYDYGSIMHYSNKSFSSNGQPTIVVKGHKNVKIGQRLRLSEKDIKKIRKMYNCQ